jgi:hypothetical protein
VTAREPSIKYGRAFWQLVRFGQTRIFVTMSSSSAIVRSQRPGEIRQTWFGFEPQAPKHLCMFHRDALSSCLFSGLAVDAADTGAEIPTRPAR